MSFQRLIEFVREGERVSPGTPNRPMRQIDQNVKYLWDLIQAAGLGSTVYAREQTIDPSLKVGMPVYFNTANQRFEGGLATTEMESGTGYLMTAASSQVWGIIATKHHDDLVDILLYGYEEIDISEAIEGGATTVEAGLYYLSGQGVGKLTQQRPPVSVPVLRADGNGHVFVNPSFVDFLDSHRHYKFEMTTTPAGSHTQPSEGEPHVITDANEALPGWLPADHESFDGNAPDGAAFGYNLEAEPYLKDMWPPLPIQSYSVDLLRSSIYEPDPREVAPLAGSVLDDLLVVDRNGIWWMSDCYDEVPWPTNLETDASESESAEECPRTIEHQMILWFTRVTFATEATVVTSLRAVDGRIKIYCRGSETEASSGDLDIDLDFEWTVGDSDRRGYLVFKELDGEKLHRGPVAEGFYAASSNVLLNSQFQTYLIPDDDTSAVVHHGLIGIGILTEPTRELASQLVRLDGVTEEFHPVLYLGMPDDMQTSMVARFDVPADAPENSKFAYRSRILGRAAGTLPLLTVEYNIASRPPDGLNTPQAVASSWSSVTIDTVATVDSDESVEATSNTLDVSPGDIVYIRVTRDPEDAADEYSGELGIMQQLGVLTSGS